jgi:HAD superfamily hydrolase (TIGR01509 family)
MVVLMIRALVFDFDGLILDTETPILDAWEQIHGRAGLACVRQEALDLIGEVDHEYDLWKAFGADADRHALKQEHRRLTRALIEKQPLLPGVRERLDEARQLGLSLAIASNSPHRWIDLHLPRRGLVEYFQTIRCRDDVARGKPEPDVYQAVLNALGLDGREAIALEDSSAGSLAAKRAGLHCIAVPNDCTRRHDFSHADLQVASLADVSLRALIAQWAN